MSSAGRAANSNGFATTPKEREIGLSGFAVPIRLSSLTGSYGLATAEHREPCESRGSSTVLGAPGGEIPPGDSTSLCVLAAFPSFCIYMLRDLAMATNFLAEKDIVIIAYGEVKNELRSGKTATELTADVMVQLLAKTGLTNRDVDGFALRPAQTGALPFHLSHRHFL